MDEISEPAMIQTIFVARAHENGSHALVVDAEPHQDAQQ